MLYHYNNTNEIALGLAKNRCNQRDSNRKTWKSPGVVHPMADQELGSVVMSSAS